MGDISQYSLSSMKMVALFVDIDEQEKRKRKYEDL